MSKPAYEIRGVCLMRIDDIMEPVCEFTWMDDQRSELKPYFSRRSLMQLFTVSMMANVPRSILFEETQAVIGKERKRLLVVFLNPEASEESVSQMWKRIRIILGKAKNRHLKKLLDSTARLVQGEEGESAS
ncbi:MAG: hypothetical protein ACFFC7_33680 [Candidatus Hermodarchaeota archaeon]